MTSSTSGHEPSPDRETSGPTGRQLLAVVGIWLLIASGTGVLTWLIGRAVTSTWTGMPEFTVAVVAEVYLAMTASLVLVLGGPRQAASQLNFRFTSARDLGLAVLVLVLTVALVVLVYLALSPLAGGPGAIALATLRQATDLSRLPNASVATLTLIVVRVAVLVGLGEELLYRGALYGWLARRRSVTTTVAVTSLVFTAQHALAPLALPYALLFGITAGWVRNRTGSTLPTFLMHAINDSAMLAVAAILVARHATT
jgi:membrane protease YdiL (CAAX protease family)